MSNIIDQIKNNKVSVLALSESPEDYFGDTKEFLDALSKNTSIHTVEFTKDFIGCFFGKERVAVVESIGKLPNIQAVTLSDSCLLIHGVANMLNSANGLRSLNMTRICMQGLQGDFDRLEKALHNHTMLKGFHMVDCTAANDDIDLEKVEHAANHKSDNPACSLSDASRELSRSGSAIAA